jgi:hypothetical protein
MPIVTTLMITLDDVGQVQVNGPIDNRILCYGLLEVAHDSVKDYNDSQKQILPVEGLAASLGSRLFRREPAGIGEPR